ncbi:2-oxoacid:acceptor oxidoreductase subunit alpha [Ktedonobacter racemifer]|uniref:Pyruvate flavodoxin/ferredoxin oxidoreductase domain protein n=1 Tax=Ktedonobacter racemifer DSM 44963 TaxID=485913 RepID=D6TPF6_KTERA|nr:2-oxoacid:acceptor oxidoreductase subunit alpha [Ktedonobacter racemifer]EFH85570.1 pyruvate flavodoxin/ferredoxin oxidoreductase domain protein [Ktedonobacter racemifer DSM 44963]
MKNEVTIRIGGESGEGTISGGDILALAAARWGYHVYTFRTFPAEILGGPCMFQVRISDQPVKSMGDYADVLICLNKEAFDRNVSDLRHGGVLIYDPSDFTPETGDFITYAIPFNEIARKEVQLFQTKNMVMLGAISGLFGPPIEAITQVVQSKLSKSRKANATLMEKNMLALEVARNYVVEKLAKHDPYVLGPVEKADRVVLNGNQAVVAGALAAQCRFFAGYPITPASDIMEGLAKELPNVGGTFLQAEDEMAALAAVLGASFGGKRAMTATSGPGFSLMTELIGLSSMAELPAVIIDAQRAGPSTGMPTKMEQSDLSFALYAGHGDTPRMIVAPANVADCYELIQLAFNMAERYQMPVLFLTDQSLTARVESVDRHIFKQGEVQARLQPEPVASDEKEAVGAGATAAHDYARFAYTASGISPMTSPGAGATPYVATGLEHNEYGHPDYEPEDHIAMMEKRFRKLYTAAEELPQPQRYGDAEATIGLIGWGSTEGTIQEAIDRAREKGYKVAALHLKILSPLPDRKIQEFIHSVQKVIVPECNYSGQLANLLGAKYGLQAIRVNKYGGIPFTAGEILRAIEEVS